ncbi:hypothetical protein TW86_22625 [Halomonas sp. S2151]|uniref:phage protein NinX family protein n=1 Tax=Halomonas sp. S2151 TaxID=579478 RepID=UPI0005F9CD9B|nr:phage protein NinX family protein [Halomonas sp. S2151]KJZ03724.1 hypothetical protein TW86_22650 [Halomonas sp. S2151]KJZ03738.1 hypothetical protein TW86_22625 [Halomonas sp. S2151]MBR9878644.1 DUF2591 domain-containing protein [Gammaproteobacteria bacterium]
MRVKTSELEGAALDWAVAKAVKAECYFTADIEWWKSPHRFAASSSWIFGGHLIDEYNIEIMRAGHEVWAKVAGLRDAACDGRTALEATCRAVVRHLLGNDVDVPEELCSE